MKRNEKRLTNPPKPVSLPEKQQSCVETRKLPQLLAIAAAEKRQRNVKTKTFQLLTAPATAEAICTFFSVPIPQIHLCNYKAYSVYTRGILSFPYRTLLLTGASTTRTKAKQEANCERKKKHSMSILGLLLHRFLLVSC